VTAGLHRNIQGGVCYVTVRAGEAADTAGVGGAGRTLGGPAGAEPALARLIGRSSSENTVGRAEWREGLMKKISRHRFCTFSPPPLFSLQSPLLFCNEITTCTRSLLLSITSHSAQIPTPSSTSRPPPSPPSPTPSHPPGPIRPRPASAPPTLSHPPRRA
jgi:hypothetical protein